MGYPLGYIPFFRLDNNRKQISGLKPIKALIDDYDMMMCGLSNNLADFDTPLHVVKGYNGDNLDELQQNLKTKKILGVDNEGGVEVHTVDVPYQARQTKANEDEKNIYRFGMGLNTAGLKDTAATTNLAIKAAYALLDMKANKTEKRLKKLLKEIIKVVIAEINEENNKDYQLSDIELDFTRHVMTNETENIANDTTRAEIKQIEVNTILNVAANVGDEKTLKAICDVMDWDFDELQDQLKKIQEEQDTATAKTALEKVIPEDE
jgi:SPP1 family phage portal protein